MFARTANSFIELRPMEINRITCHLVLVVVVNGLPPPGSRRRRLTTSLTSWSWKITFNRLIIRNVLERCCAASLTKKPILPFSDNVAIKFNFVGSTCQLIGCVFYMLILVSPLIWSSRSPAFKWISTLFLALFTGVLSYIGSCRIFYEKETRSIDKVYIEFIHLS